MMEEYDIEHLFLLLEKILEELKAMHEHLHTLEKDVEAIGVF